MRSRALLAAALLAAVPAQAALVGPGVGNGDLLLAQGNKAYNAKNYAEARDLYLRATRARPELVPAYLALARAYLQSKKRALSCTTYRAYLRAAPDSGERTKAQAELDLCEKQLAANPEAEDPGAKFTALKGALLQAIDRGVAVGAGSAQEALVALLGADYAAPDLGDLAGKAKALAEKVADEAMAAAALPGAKADALETGAAASRFAADVGAEEAPAFAKASFLEGSAALARGKNDAAADAFAKSNALAANPEARFRKGVALWKKGDRSGAVAYLQRELKDDPRSGLLALAVAVQGASEGKQAAAAVALEEFLFEQKFKK